MLKSEVLRGATVSVSFFSSSIRILWPINQGNIQKQLHNDDNLTHDEDKIQSSAFEAPFEKYAEVAIIAMVEEESRPRIFLFTSTNSESSTTQKKVPSFASLTSTLIRSEERNNFPQLSHIVATRKTKRREKRKPSLQLVTSLQHEDKINNNNNNMRVEMSR